MRKQPLYEPQIRLTSCASSIVLGSRHTSHSCQVVFRSDAAKAAWTNFSGHHLGGLGHLQLGSSNSSPVAMRKASCATNHYPLESECRALMLMWSLRPPIAPPPIMGVFRQYPPLKRIDRPVQGPRNRSLY